MQLEPEDTTGKIKTRGGWATKFEQLALPDNVDMFNSHIARGDSLKPNELAKLGQQTILHHVDAEGNDMLKTMSDKRTTQRMDTSVYTQNFYTDITSMFMPVEHTGMEPARLQIVFDKETNENMQENVEIKINTFSELYAQPDDATFAQEIADVECPVKRKQMEDDRATYLEGIRQKRLKN